MPMPYQNNMYHQMPYVQQQYGVNSYIPYMQPRFQQPEVQVPQQPPQAQQMPGGLNGMVVQTIENVTADCVPMDGSAAFFPKQDLSEIYVKSWCADGTIRTLVFKPVEVTGILDCMRTPQQYLKSVLMNCSEKSNSWNRQ